MEDAEGTTTDSQPWTNVKHCVVSKAIRIFVYSH